MPLIGFLNPGSPEPFAHLVAAFRAGLSETGFVEGQNVAIEYRWAEGRNERLPALADELVRLQVAVIAGPSSTAAVRAAKTATTSIPIVFTIGADPVKVGLVSNFNRPGGNITGMSYLANLLVPKRVELLKELVPSAETIGMLLNPNNPNAESDRSDAQAAAGALGRKDTRREGRQRNRIGAGFRHPCSTASCRSSRRSRSTLHHSPGATRGTGGAACRARDL